MGINKLSRDAESITVMLEVLILQDQDYIVTHCPALNLSAYGKTESEAKIAFDQVLQIFIEETTSSGTLERYLLSLGWQLKQKPTIQYAAPEVPVAMLKSNNLINTARKKISIPVN